jgi:hypothetical protein
LSRYEWIFGVLNQKQEEMSRWAERLGDLNAKMWQAISTHPLIVRLLELSEIARDLPRVISRMADSNSQTIKYYQRLLALIEPY